MTGIKLDKENNSPLLSPAKKEQIKRRKQNFKFGITLLLSNLCIFLFASQLYNNDKEKIDPLPPSIFQISHPNHHKLKLPIKTFFPITDELRDKKEISIDIYSEKNKLLIRQAFFHPFEGNFKAKRIQLSDIDSNYIGQQYYTVEISYNQLDKITRSQNSVYYVYPSSKNHPLNSSKPKTTPRSSYEIIF